MAHNPCDTCAFTPGSDANREPENHLKGMLCLLAPNAFYCHENIDWRNTPASMSGKEFRETGFVICQGWRREVLELKEAGYYKDRPLLKRGIGIAGLGALEIFVSTSGDESEDGRENHSWAWGVFTRSLRMLVKMARPFRKRGPREKTLA